MKKLILCALSMFFMFALGSPAVQGQGLQILEFQRQPSVIEFQTMPKMQIATQATVQTNDTLEQVQALGFMLLGGVLVFGGLEIINRLPHRRVSSRSRYNKEDDEPDTADANTDPPMPPTPTEQPVPAYRIAWAQDVDGHRVAFMKADRNVCSGFGSSTTMHGTFLL
jgi:outer membrane biosynthesis protein TonB